MKVKATVIGFLVGMSLVVGVSLLQSEVKIVDGRPERVVELVVRNRAYETPIVRRCLLVGVPAGLVGAGIGYFVAAGANLGAVFLGAVLLAAMSSGWRENWPKKFGRAGENAKLSDSLLHGLVGGLFGAAAMRVLVEGTGESEEAFAAAGRVGAESSLTSSRGPPPRRSATRQASSVALIVPSACSIIPATVPAISFGKKSAIQTSRQTSSPSAKT